MFGSPPTPKPVPLPQQIVQAPKPDDRAAKEAEARQRQRARLARGFASTIATSPLGIIGGPMEQQGQRFGG